MDEVAFLLEAHTAGLHVRADGARLIVRGPKRLAALAHRLLSYQAEILPLVELFEERAAIMQYDAGLCRDEAERLAWHSVLGEETDAWTASASSC